MSAARGGFFRVINASLTSAWQSCEMIEQICDKIDLEFTQRAQISADCFAPICDQL